MTLQVVSREVPASLTGSVWPPALWAGLPLCVLDTLLSLLNSSHSPFNHSATAYYETCQIIAECHLVRSEKNKKTQHVSLEASVAAGGGSGLGRVSGWVHRIIPLPSGGPPVMFHTRSTWIVSGCRKQQSLWWSLFSFPVL